MEPFAAKSRNGHDESIYDFGCRRIGKEAADFLIQPMVSGIFGGVAERMSLQSCFPLMKEMESKHGSLFRAMIAKAREAKANGKKSGGPSGPGGWLTSFYGGLDTITNRFEDLYFDHISADSKVTSIRKEGSLYKVEVVKGEYIEAKHVILATPSYNAAEIVSSIATRLSESLAAIPYAPIAVVCLGYKSESVKSNLDGFGFLVPSKEKRKILGSIWTSSIFRDRAPNGFVQFRSMVGGDGDHQSAKLSEAELVSLVKSDLNSILGIAGDPTMTKIYRWEKGIPQYHIGHTEILSRIEIELRQLGNIYLAGNAYYGIGLNDCVRQSHRIVAELLA
jgi:oxygen-dependent protoporphyrinogen oxidase